MVTYHSKFKTIWRLRGRFRYCFLSKIEYNFTDNDDAGGGNDDDDFDDDDDDDDNDDEAIH